MNGGAVSRDWGLVVSIRKLIPNPLKLIPLSLFVIPAVFAGEIDIAREALRDGLWEVARQHAANADGDEGRLIVLESYAREGNWDELSETISRWGGDETARGDEYTDATIYYRALSLAERGEKDSAADILASANFKSHEYKRLGARLRASLAADSGDASLALKLIKESGFESAGAEAKMVAAGILQSSGDKKGAEKIWREVTSDPNAPERAFATAAANLGDASLLRAAVSRSTDAATRRFAGLRLGRILIQDAQTFAEGAKTIKAVVKDAPDTEGAKETAIALADALIARETWQEAADALRDILEIWPDSAHLAMVQEGRGWTFRKLSRNEEALEAFSRAEEAATDDEGRARAMLEQGDVLSDMGRGDEAMAKYRAILDKFPDSTAAGKLKIIVKRREMEAKGRLLYADYRFAEAQKAFQELAEADPENADRAEFLQVLCLYGQGFDGEAAEKARLLAASAKSETVRAEATLWLAKFAYNSGRWNESGRLFSAYADMKPDSPRAQSALTWAARAAFAENDFNMAIRLVTRLAEKYPDSPEKTSAYLIQGEALMELGRFDEAVLVFEHALIDGATTGGEEKLRAQVLKADALFAMGADNPARYREALEAYRAVRIGESLPPGLRLAVSFKMGKTLEKLKRINEAIDQYYTGVVLAYREGRQKGVQFDDEARAAFARAAFRLADEYESRGKDFQAMHILELVIASDVPASDEAERRLERIQTKGKFL